MSVAGVAMRCAGAVSLAVMTAPALPATAHAATSPKTTVTVSPTGGPPGATFQATLTYAPGPCAGGRVGFYPQPTPVWGTQLAPTVPMPASCTVTSSITVPARYNTPGAVFVFYGIYRAQNRSGRAVAEFTIRPTAAPTVTAAAPRTQPTASTRQPNHRSTASANESAAAPVDQPLPTSSPGSPQVTDTGSAAALVSGGTTASPLLWIVGVGLAVIGLAGAGFFLRREA